MTRLVIALALALAAPAGAEIYRCQQADGTVTFTGDPASCAGGARRHEPSGNVQTVPIERAPVRPPVPAAVAPVEDGQAIMWRRKRLDAERELGALEGGIDEFRQLVSWCNRGGDLTVENQYGLPRDYSCDDARVTYERMTARIGELHYKERVGVGNGFTASLVAGDGKIYVTAETGDIVVVKAGTKFEKLAVNEMGEVCMSAPAISDGILYFRTRGNLVAIRGAQEPE